MRRVTPDGNVVLIGMPGVGKSTAGVLLAKRLNKGFVDTDLLVQSRAGRRLQEIIDQQGLTAFLTMEEKTVLALHCVNSVIATGGSVVYSQTAMTHLKQQGKAVYLWLPLNILEMRVTDLGSRGIVMEPGQTYAQLYAARAPLYERYADITVDCGGLSHEQTVDAILRCMAKEMC